MGKAQAGAVRLPALIGALGATGRKLLARRLATEEWVTELGLRRPSYGVLMVIDRLGPISQKQISDQMALDPSDLVGVIDGLEGAGLVDRTRDPQDRRRYSLTLTAAGRRTLARFDSLAAEVEDDLLAPLSEQERRVFRGLVERILAHQRQPDPPA